MSMYLVLVMQRKVDLSGTCRSMEVSKMTNNLKISIKTTLTKNLAVTVSRAIVL